MKVALGADHLGWPLKDAFKAHLIDLGHEVVDFGVTDAVPVDYPDVAVTVAREVAAGTFGRAILVCGTGIGMAITANKIPGVRAATVADPYSAERARMSNDAQVLCLGARVVPSELAMIIVDHWLTAEFQGGASRRRSRRSRPWTRRTAVRPCATDSEGVGGRQERGAVARHRPAAPPGCLDGRGVMELTRRA